MVFRPVIHLFVLVVIALVAATFVFLSARRSLRTNLMDVIRRSLIAVVVIIMGAGPSIPGTIIEVTSNIEVYFVIDRTGSMGAEDWDGENPRIDGVRNDVATLMGVLTGARYSILSWDSSVHTDMPLTTDSSAVASYMGTFTRELSSSSQGSSINRPAADLAKLLKKNKERHPENIRTVFILSDGETSNQDHWSSAPSGSEDDWDDVKPYIDGGLVIGYGTEEGGKMKAVRLSNAGLRVATTNTFMTSPSPVPPSPSRVSMRPPSKASRRGSASATCIRPTSQRLTPTRIPSLTTHQSCPKNGICATRTATSSGPSP